MTDLDKKCWSGKGKIIGFYYEYGFLFVRFEKGIRTQVPCHLSAFYILAYSLGKMGLEITDDAWFELELMMKEYVL